LKKALCSGSTLAPFITVIGRIFAKRIVGEVSKEQDKLQDDIYEVTQDATPLMKPGVPIAEVARECGRALERRGYEATYDCGRMGHGMGLMSTEPHPVTIREQKASDILRLPAISPQTDTDFPAR